MDFDVFMKMARGEVPFTKIQLDGGQTQGRLKHSNGPVKKNQYVDRERKGCGYAEKYQQQPDDAEEEKEEVEVAKLNPPFKSMAAVEDLTSYGSCEDPNLIEGDALLKVYDDYSFDYSPNTSLPIHKLKDTILGQIEENSVVVIKGPTGCGKSTQVPQYILDDARESQIYCNIIITQPRRIAAMSVAKRVCEERSWILGTLVGYQIALEKRATKDTRLLYCTAGVLLQQLISQKSLSAYTHIIIDEVHERDQETDFLLIVLKKLLRIHGNRTKVILMSATICTDKFTQYFSKNVKGYCVAPPVIELVMEQARFKEEIYYLDDLLKKNLTCLGANDVTLDEPKISNLMYELVPSLLRIFFSIEEKKKGSRTFAGAVLIFLPGLHEIDSMYKILQQRNHSNSSVEKWMICPLHSTISFDEQMKVFMQPPKGHRKIILATNIAESSITVPDVEYVIDFCLTKHQVQDKNTFYSALQLCWVSKSQAIQRAGRVGRTMPGRTYRLVPRDVYEGFEEDCTPEILRSPLDILVLKSKTLNMGPPIEILGSAMDPPNLTNIQRTMLNLKEMGALTLKVNDKYCEEDGELTFMGKVMASLPLDTNLTKLILIGHMFSMLHECIIMACCMSGRNIFSSPYGEHLNAFNSKLSWADDSASDPLTFLSVYKVWSQQTKRGHFSRSGGESEVNWAKRYFVQLKSLKEVDRLQSEVTIRLEHLGIRENRIDSVRKNEHLHPLLLKVALAGAFYPNYFTHAPIEEKEAVRILGGLDPCKTVYFTKFPQNQPGKLYAHSIRQLLSQCGSNIKVHFDQSAKVYVEFGNSLEKNDRDDFVDVVVPGRVMKAVYRAIKMRQLDIPMKIPIYSVQEAQKKAKAIFGDSLNPQLFCWSTKSGPARKNVSRMPHLTNSHVQVSLTHIIDPHNFYVQLHFAEGNTKQIWLSNQINKKDAWVNLPPESIEENLLCLAPYTTERNTLYYRAKVLKVEDFQAKVYYLDFGNTERLEKCLLKGYGPKLIADGIKDEAPLAYHCRLAEVQPLAFPSGGWTKEAIRRFKDLENLTVDAQIYSIVGETMALYVFLGTKSPQQRFKFSIYDSFNHILVSAKEAQLMDEPYLSKSNHELREKATTNPEMYLNCEFGLGEQESPYENMEYKSPTLVDTNNRSHTLLGPKSPLEITVNSITRKCQGKSVSVDPNSVNSVFLDNNPMDTSTKLMIAAFVTQSYQRDRLTLRNTTIMPATRGMVGLMCLIFSPFSELRVDPTWNHITGALCGLGHDEDGMSYDQDNDIEIAFDCKFDMNDIELVNKIRFWMNRMMLHPANNDEASGMGSREAAAKAQTLIVKYLLQLLMKTRAPLSSLPYDNAYEWNEVPFEKLENPSADCLTLGLVFSLIWGVKLNQQSVEEMKTSLLRHKKKLDQYISGATVIKSTVTCELCQVHMDTLQAITLHVKTAVHKTREREAAKECGLSLEDNGVDSYSNHR